MATLNDGRSKCGSKVGRHVIVQLRALLTLRPKETEPVSASAILSPG